MPDIYFELAKHRETPYFMEILGLEKVVPFSSCCLLFVETLATSVHITTNFFHVMNLAYECIFGAFLSMSHLSYTLFHQRIRFYAFVIMIS